MQVEQQTWCKARGWKPALMDSPPPVAPKPLNGDAKLVLAFGDTEHLRCGSRIEELRSAYPHAQVIGCSTAGEICGTQVLDESVVATAIAFRHTWVRTACVRLCDAGDSFAAGRRIAQTLSAPALAHALVLSDGLKVNGSELVKGLVQNLPAKVAVTGGLSGDGARFKQTLVCHNNGPEEGAIVAVGFYGDRLKVGYGSLGGWDPFGPERRITRSKGNVLFELDGHCALDVYKRYLGEHAAQLPSSGLLFPLTLRTAPGETPVVRTILAVDEKAQTLTFAGDVPEGAYARLMRANFERLIDGATAAARTSCQRVDSAEADLAILISCVGRKLILKQRTEEEVEGVRSVLGERPALAGFYSYGEISPFAPSAKCELHNQTMTVTTFSEQ
jgi:hypothetical protein